MTKRLVLQIILFACVSCSASAQDFGKTLTLTLEDDATIQQGVQQPEKISGGAVARFWLSESGNNGLPVGIYIATDFRMHSKSWAVRWNPQPCGGHLLTPSSPTGLNTEVATVTLPGSNFVTVNPVSSNGIACPAGLDTAVVTIAGVQGTGAIFCGGFFNSPLDAPGEVPGFHCIVDSGPVVAVITGTLRVEVSDYGATVVKLRQGIPPVHTLDGNPPWELNQYDSDTTADNTIYRWGCKLTSLSMLLNSSTVSTLPSQYGTNDPGNLNRWMLQNSGYDAQSGAVLSVPTVASLATALPKTLKFNVAKHDSSADLNAAQNFLDDTLKNIGAPILVGVDDSCTASEPFPCHFVAVWGKRNGEFLIADPKPTNNPAKRPTCVQNGGTCINLKLSDYPRYETYGYITDPSNLSGLAIATASNVHLTLKASTGQQTGFDTGTQSVVDGIPGSGYFIDTIVDDIDGSAARPTTRLVEASEIADGQYTLSVTGLTSGGYAVDIAVVSSDGSIQPTLTVSGNTQPGLVSRYNLGIITAPGGISTVAPAITFASTIQDINDATRSGEIVKLGIGQSLTAKIQAAASYATSGDCADAIDVLKAFTNEINAQVGKAIDATAAQLLLQDAAYLVTHCGI